MTVDMDKREHNLMVFTKGPRKSNTKSMSPLTQAAGSSIGGRSPAHMSTVDGFFIPCARDHSKYFILLVSFAHIVWFCISFRILKE